MKTLVIRMSKTPKTTVQRALAVVASPVRSEDFQSVARAVPGLAADVLKSAHVDARPQNVRGALQADVLGRERKADVIEAGEGRTRSSPSAGKTRTASASTALEARPPSSVSRPATA